MNSLKSNKLRKDLPMNTEQFIDLLAEKGISLNPFQIEQYDTYYKTLVEWNEKMNLTAITEKEDVYLKHFFDSLTAGFYFNFDQRFKFVMLAPAPGSLVYRLKLLFQRSTLPLLTLLIKELTFLELGNSIKVGKCPVYPRSC